MPVLSDNAPVIEIATGPPESWRWRRFHEKEWRDWLPKEPTPPPIPRDDDEELTAEPDEEPAAKSATHALKAGNGGRQSCNSIYIQAKYLPGPHPSGNSTTSATSKGNRDRNQPGTSSSPSSPKNGGHQPEPFAFKSTPKSKNSSTNKSGKHKGSRSSPKAGKMKTTKGKTSRTSSPQTTCSMIAAEFAGAKANSRSVFLVPKRTSPLPPVASSVHPLTWVGVGLSWGFRQLSPAWRMFPSVNSEPEFEQGVEEDLD